MIRISRARLRREVAEDLSKRARRCATKYSSLTSLCDRAKGHEGPCGGDLAAEAFRSFTDEDAERQESYLEYRRQIRDERNDSGV